MVKSKITTALIPHQIKNNGELFLGIPTGIVGKSFSLTKITTLKNKPGWIVRKDSIEEWKVKGFCKIEDDIFLYGALVEGRSLEELLTVDIDQFLPHFYNLISALNTLKNNSIPLFPITTHSVFFLNDGGILFLPPEIFMELIDLRSFEDKVRVFTICNHPDRDTEDNLSFSLGVFLYKILTGTYPYFSENEEELHHMIRELPAASPRLSKPGLKDSVVQLIESALHTTRINIPGLGTWQDAVKDWIDNGIQIELSETEKSKIREIAEQKKERSTKHFQLKVFWRQNFVKIAAISLIVLTVGSIIGVTIKNIFFRTRLTAGLSPVELVHTYYESINSLDYLKLTDCVIKGAGKAELETVMNLYVMTRQRSAYEQGPTFISAKDWDTQGRPPLQPFLPMYGVTKLQILDQKYEPEPTFTMSYEKWTAETENIDQENFTGTVVYSGFFIEEQLSLKKDKDDWVIYNITILEKRKIDPIE